MKASRLMADAVIAVRHLKDRKQPKPGSTIDDLMIAVHEAEEEGDSIHHQFLAELFDSGFNPSR